MDLRDKWHTLPNSTLLFMTTIAPPVGGLHCVAVHFKDGTMCARLEWPHSGGSSVIFEVTEDEFWNMAYIEEQSDTRAQYMRKLTSYAEGILINSPRNMAIKVGSHSFEQRYGRLDIGSNNYEPYRLLD